MQDDVFAATEFKTMSIDELHILYRSWPIRHKNRLAEGREYLTYYIEHRIVK